MKPYDQTEYIVQALRMQGAMYEKDARAFLAEHDGNVRSAALTEGAEAIDVKQDEYEAEERQRFGHLDHEAVLQREAVRDMAALLRQMADEGKATAPAAPVAPDFFQPGHAYTHRDGTDFKCVAVTTHPQTGERLAMGWHVDSWALHYPATVGINQWNHEYDGVQPPTSPEGGDRG